MLLLSALASPSVTEATVFPDHQDDHLVYYLPPGLVVATTAAGDPDFFLMRYHGDFAQAEGGLLRVTLDFAPLSQTSLVAARAAGWTVRAISFSAGQFRLRLRSLSEGKDDLLGEWRRLALASDQLLVPAVGLTPHEVELLRPLLESGQSSVEVDVDLRYPGLIPGRPWLATAQTVALKRVLAVLLPSEPARADQVVAAFQSLPSPLDGLVCWQPLEAGVTEPPRDAMLAEIAMHSLATLFHRQPNGSPFDPPCYQLAPVGGEDLATTSWDLSITRLEERSAALTWSITELYDRLGNPEQRQKFFPTVSQVSPFAQVTIHVVNQLPLDAHYLRKVQVDVRYPGLSGLPEYHTSTFDGPSQLDRFNVSYPALTTTFQLAMQITATLAPPGGAGWPIVLKRDWAPISGLLVDVGRKEAGIDFVRVEAEAGVFDQAAKVDVSIFAGTTTPSPVPAPSGAASSATPTVPKPVAQVTLNATNLGSWVALPGGEPSDALRALVVAFPKSDPTLPPFTVHDGLVDDRQVKVAAWQLEVLDPDPILISLDPAVVSDYAFVAIAIGPVAGGETYLPLTPAQSHVWNLFRTSVFAPIRFRYRVDYQAFDANHQAQPMVSGGWVTGEGTSLVIRPVS